jgi:hypothetical protein
MMEVQEQFAEQGQQFGEEEAEDEGVRFHDRCCVLCLYFSAAGFVAAASAFVLRPLSFILSPHVILRLRMKGMEMSNNSARLNACCKVADENHIIVARMCF